MTDSTEEVYDLCVVGSGISGLAGVEAYLTVRPSARILVLEADQRLGGHDNTVEIYNPGVRTNDGKVSLESTEKTLVDCGFMVYNERTYPNMLRLYEKFGIDGKASDMSLSTYYRHCGTNEATVGDTAVDTWSFGSTLNWIMCNIWRPRLWRFLRSHAKFRHEACKVLAGKASGVAGQKSDTSPKSKAGRDAYYSLGDFCKNAIKGEKEFEDCWLRPFVKAVWSLPSDRRVDDYPVFPLFQFMENHGFLSDPTNLTPWMTPKHRSHALVGALLGEAADSATWPKKAVAGNCSEGSSISSGHTDKDITSKTNARVLSVSQPDQLGIITVEAQAQAQTGPDGNAVTSPNSMSQYYKARHVLLAGSGVTQTAIVNKFYPGRFQILNGKVSVSQTRGILHSDASYMPARKSDWSAWNVGRTHSTYWINKIQGQPGGDLFFTLPLEGFLNKKTNAVIHDFFDVSVLEQFEGGVLHVWDTTHPVYEKNTGPAVAALQREARGSRLQHCGAWMRHGFHEDGIVSARLAVRELLQAGDSDTSLGSQAQIPVYFPMAANPNIFVDKISVPLLHTVIKSGKTGSSKSGANQSFSSVWYGYVFNSLSPPNGVLACDHAFASGRQCRFTEENTLLQDGAIREAFLEHTGIFPAGPILVYTMPRSTSVVPGFNPFSWYVAYDGIGGQFQSPREILASQYQSATQYGSECQQHQVRPLAFLAEVHNTPWGEAAFYGWRHPVSLTQKSTAGLVNSDSDSNAQQPAFPYEIRLPKTMHVSPMNKVPRIETDGTLDKGPEKDSDETDSVRKSEYVFRLKSPAAVSISLHESDVEVFRADFCGDNLVFADETSDSDGWKFYGSIRALAEVYARAASKLFRGERTFYNYSAAEQGWTHERKEASDENEFVWFSGFAYWTLSILYFLVQFGCCSRTASMNLDARGVACGLLLVAAGRFSMVFSKRFHISSETDLGMGLLSYVTWMVARFVLFILILASEISGNEGQPSSGLLSNTICVQACLRWIGVIVVQTVVLPLLPISRCSRVSLQSLEPVIGHFSGEVIRVTGQYMGMYSSHVADQSLHLLFSTTDIDSPANNSPSSTLKTAACCLMFWVVGRVMLSVLAQLFFYPGRMHQRQLGLRAAVHTEAEKFSVFSTAIINACMMTTFSVVHFSTAFAQYESVIGVCLQTHLQCTFFGAYCLSDLFVGGILWRARFHSATGFIGKTQTSIDATLSEDKSGLNGGTPTYIAKLYTDFGFDIGVFIHHSSCMLIASLGVIYGLWRHEFVWTSLFELSTLFLYIWSACRKDRFGRKPSHPPTEATTLGPRTKDEVTRSPFLDREIPPRVPIITSVLRFFSFILFAACFLVTRIMIASVSVYFLVYYRLPFTFSLAQDRERLLGLPSSFDNLRSGFGLQMSFWVTLVFGFIPLLALQFVWFRKIVKLWKFECLPLLEAVLNEKIGSDWFEVVCLPDPATNRKGKSAVKSGASCRTGNDSGGGRSGGSLRKDGNDSNDSITILQKDAGTAKGQTHAAYTDTHLKCSPKYRLILHSPWKVVYSFLTRGDVGFGESFVAGDWSCEVVGLQQQWEQALYTALRHLCKLSYANSGNTDPSSTGGLGEGLGRFFSSLLRLVTPDWKLLIPDHASVSLPDMCSSESRQESISEHYDGDQDLFSAFQGSTRVYTAALYSAEELCMLSSRKDWGPTVGVALVEDQRLGDLLASTDTCQTSIDNHNRRASRILDSAQRRKNDRILGDLGGLRRRERGDSAVSNARAARVLDIGCGYGELIIQAASDFDVSYALGITNSFEMCQEFERRISDDSDYISVAPESATVNEPETSDHTVAKRVAHSEAIRSAAHVQKSDFLEGFLAAGSGEGEKFDLITSVESIEAIHHCQYRKLAAECRKALKDDGRAVFQIIHGYGSRNPTIRRKTFQPGCTFVQTYIFPGQQIPYLEYVLDEFRAEGLLCTHVEHSGLHYAKTLRIWREKLWHSTTYHAAAPPAATPNQEAAKTVSNAESASKGENGTEWIAPWSQAEYRKFAFYLAWCEAGFREGVLDVARCVFVKG